MERLQVRIWANLLLPLSAALPAGCDSLTSFPTGAPSALSATRESDPDFPLKRVPPPQIVPVDFSDPSESTVTLRVESAPEPLPEVIASPVSEGGPDFSLPEQSSVEPPQSIPEPPTAIDHEPTRLPAVESVSEAIPGLDEVAPLAPPSPAEESFDPAPPAVSDLSPLIREEAVEVQRTELPWARFSQRTAEMKAVMKRADVFNQRGMELAGRGALYSARTRFTQALRIIAEALDAEQDTTTYSQALTAGMTALEEADDFGSRRIAPDRQIDVAHVIAGHRTPLLKNAGVKLTPLLARQRYYNYAQEQLATAAGREAAGSEALYGLGKIAVAAGKMDDRAKLDSMARAMVCYQASLLTDPRNFRAANELGVLLVEAGRLERARELFALSASLAPHAATWHNLAIVHQQLGEADLAAQASAQAERVARAVPDPNRPAVKWVDSTTFARSTGPSEGLLAPSFKEPAMQAATPAAEMAKSPAAQKPATAETPRRSWLPWR